MWVVICDRSDVSAHWLAAQLRARGITPLEEITADDLADAPCWEHRLGSREVSLEITLGDGREISSKEIRGGINRLVGIPLPTTVRADEGDQKYARSETFAFYLSWLSCLPGPLLNRPTPQALHGAWHSPARWTALALAAGLPVQPLRISSESSSCPRNGGGASDTVVEAMVIGSEVFPRGLSAEIAQGCRRLSQRTGSDILGLRFVNDGGLRFEAATSLPDLRLGGVDSVAVVADLLRGTMR